MARTHERVFALIGAILFLGTSVAVSVVVVLQVRQQNKQQQDNQAIQQALDKVKNQGAKLEGTKLENFTPVAKVDQLQKIDLQEGTGDVVKPGDTVTAHYTGAVAATGIIFQSSHDSGAPAVFPLNQVIKGWTDGVPGMKVGGKRRLLIPADQAYGANPPSGSGISANADLVFDIELVKIGQ
ncbi:MAG TPA: FKBP-type peptidyl-prolyl cis-trans isomerase [Candidatus Saccharimonadales bacterium]|nr:FKBP-type peptidyl-prolyl cis-trans isomerase [Candidatus Saccharimonadales bacterium]